MISYHSNNTICIKRFFYFGQTFKNVSVHCCVTLPVVFRPLVVNEIEANKNIIILQTSLKKNIETVALLLYYFECLGRFFLSVGT